MAIKTVRAKLNGTWHTLTYDASSGKYVSSAITAPGQTSFNMDGGYYPVTIEATNDAGTSTTVGVTDATVGASLKLVVKETIPPVITIVSPSDDAYVSNNLQPIVFNVLDEQNGSGVDPDSIVVKIDGNAVTDITKTAIANGYTCTANPTTLTDGEHTVTIDASDNDGNTAVQVSSSFTVDTIPPVLNITSPADGLITATRTLTVAGITNDSSASPVTLTVKLNGISQGTVAVASTGSFSKEVSLAEGQNYIVVIATDRAGKTTTVERTVTLDTTVPKVKSVSITPNPVDAGTTVIISVEVE